MKYVIVYSFIFCAALYSCGVSTRSLPVFLADDGGSTRSRNGTEMYWAPEDFPLRVIVDEDVDPITYLSVLVATIEWNNAVGHELFEVFTAPTEDINPRECRTIIVRRYDIQEVLNTPEVWDAFHRGRTHPGSSQFCLGYIAMDDEPSDEWLIPIFVHELGHSLGLAHDGIESSIMYPTIRGSRVTKSIQEEDIRRVRAMAEGNFSPRRAPWLADRPTGLWTLTPHTDYRPLPLSWQLTH